jgi:hypothetical protein
MSKPLQKPRTWGFRFSTTDAIVICLAAAAAVVLQRLENPLWWMLIIVAGHFFLFCNVFRIRRKFEFSWAVLFLINFTVWLWLEKLDWLPVLGTQLPITTCIVLAELRSSRYHGIFALQTNSQLNDYLEGKIS